MFGKTNKKDSQNNNDSRTETANVRETAYKGKKATDIIVYTYPQLTLTPAEGMSQSREYRDIVGKGILPEEIVNPFITSKEDVLSVLQIGDSNVGILLLRERADFERFVQVMGHKCENVPIQPHEGADTFLGIINWRRIYEHKEEYLKSGKFDWPLEFGRFTAEKRNYQDTFIVISNGYYSAVGPEAAGLPEKEWIDASRVIRIWHEATHVFLRKKYLIDIDAISEEVLADAVGLYAAFGRYDSIFAKTFLGIEGDMFRKGGRLELYISEQLPLEESVMIANEAVAATEGYFNALGERKPDNFELMRELYGAIMDN